LSTSILITSATDNLFSLQKVFYPQVRHVYTKCQLQQITIKMNIQLTMNSITTNSKKNYIKIKQIMNTRNTNEQNPKPIKPK